MANLWKPNSSTTSSSQSTDPYGIDKYWSMVQPGFQDIIDKQGKTGPAYDGNLSTGWTGGQEGALETAKSYLNPDSLTGKVASGSYLDVQNNPTYQAAIRNINNQFGDNVNSLNTKFSPWSSSSMRQSAANDLSQSYSNGLADTWANQYNTEMNRALSAQNQMSSWNKDVSSMEQNKQATQQSGLDSTYKEWLRQQGVAENSINNFLQAASLLKSPTTDSTSQTSQKSTFLGK